MGVVYVSLGKYLLYDLSFRSYKVLKLKKNDTGSTFKKIVHI